MSAQHETSQTSQQLQRRNFLKASGAITAMAFVGTGTLSSIVYADALTDAQREILDPDDILALMKKGNKRYTGQREDHDFLAEQ
jgi:carbonic anhydrase